MSVNGTLDPDQVWGFLKGSGTRKKQPGQSQAPSEVGPSRQRFQDKEGQEKVTDSTKTAPKPSGGGGTGPFDIWRGFISGLSLLTSPIEPLSISFSRSNNDTKSNLEGRPAMAYVFGFSDTVLVNSRAGSQGISNVDATSQTDAISVKNNIKVFRFLTVNNSFALSSSERHQNGSDNWSESKAFPNLSTSLGQIEKVIPFRWIFVSASAKTGYSAKTDKSWAGSKTSVPTSTVTTTGFSPLISISGNTKRGIRLNFSVDQSTSTTEPDVGTRTERSSMSWRLTADYTFRSPNGIPIPLLRSIRLNSQMSLSMTVSGRTSDNKTATKKDGEWTPYQLVNSSSELSVSPQANYSFSSRVKGGFSAEWRDSKDNSGGAPRKSHIRELGIWVEFSF